MRVISIEEGGLLSQFLNINENDFPLLERFINLPPQNLDTPHQKMLKNKHTDAKKGKFKNYFVFRRFFSILQKF